MMLSVFFHDYYGHYLHVEITQFFFFLSVISLISKGSTSTIFRKLVSKVQPHLYLSKTLRE